MIKGVSVSVGICRGRGAYCGVGVRNGEKVLLLPVFVRVLEGGGALPGCGRGGVERFLLLREGVGVGSRRGRGARRGRGSATTPSAAHNNDRYIPRVRRKRHDFAPRFCRRYVMAKSLLLFAGNSQVKWAAGIFFTNIGKFIRIKIT